MSNKTIAAILAVALVLGIFSGITVSFLTRSSETVTNTFSMGNIGLDLLEHEYGITAQEYAEVKFRSDIVLTPGAYSAKDPFVRVESGSEDCYIFVTVSSTLGNKATYDISVGTEDTQWTLIDTKQETVGAEQ